MSKIRESGEADKNEKNSIYDRSDTAEKQPGFLMNLIQRIRNAKSHMYKYVHPCPECGSKCTGRYVKEPFSETDRYYMERETLKYGEIVRFIEKIPYKNLFCVDCNHKWHGEVETRWYNNAQIEKEVEDRGTYEAYIEVIEEQSYKAGSSKKKLF